MRHPLLKTLIAFTLLVTFAAPALAIGPGIGVRLGGSAGDLSIDPSTGITDGPSPRTNFFGGLYKGFPLAPMTSIELGAYYAQKGAKASFEGFGETETRLDYLEIPALFKVKPVAFPVYLAAGGFLSFKLSAKDRVDGGEWVDAENVKSTDVGLAFAAGMDFPLTAVTLNLDLRYDLGLTNISDAEGVSAKTRTLIGSIGLYF